MTSDIAWSGADCTPGVTPRQLVQSSSENDTLAGRARESNKPSFVALWTLNSLINYGNDTLQYDAFPFERLNKTAMS